MSFFNEESPVSKQQEKEPLRLARKLANCVKGHRLNRGFVNPKKWEVHFYWLISKHTLETVQEVVDWYALNIMKDRVPQAYSGKTFKEKFPFIVKSMQIDKGSSRNQGVTLSKDAQEVLKRIDKSYSWPNGSERQLPSFVQRCFDNYSTFYAQLKAFKPEEYSDEWRLKRYLLDTRYCSPIEFTLIWIEFIQDVLERWEEWTGSLNAYVWSLKNEWTIRKEEGVAYDYGVGCVAFGKFIDHVTKGS